MTLRFVDIFGDEKSKEEDNLERERNKIYGGTVKISSYIDDAIMAKFGKC